MGFRDPGELKAPQGCRGEWAGGDVQGLMGLEVSLASLAPRENVGLTAYLGCQARKGTGETPAPVAPRAPWERME